MTSSRPHGTLRRLVAAMATAMTMTLAATAATESKASTTAARTADTRHPVSVIDDGGHRVSLPSPAVRIISLAPHITELL